MDRQNPNTCGENTEPETRSRLERIGSLMLRWIAPPNSAVIPVPF
jgi:hypothetical protein